MSQSAITKWAAVSTVLAGVLLTVGFVLHPAAEDLSTISASGWVPSHLLVMAGALFLLLGMIGLYSRHIRAGGVVGFIGFVAAFTGTALLLSFAFVEGLLLPAMVTNTPEFAEALLTGRVPSGVLVALPLTLLLFALGWAFFGTSGFRASDLPRWAFVVTALGAVLFAAADAMFKFLLPISGVALGAGLLWLGLALWSGRGALEPSLER